MKPSKTVSLNNEIDFKKKLETVHEGTQNQTMVRKNEGDMTFNPIRSDSPKQAAMK